MPAYQIRPLTEPDLPEVSAFLDRSMETLFGAGEHDEEGLTRSARGDAEPGETLAAR